MPKQSAKSTGSESQKRSGVEKQQPANGSSGQKKQVVEMDEGESFDLRAILKLPGPKRPKSGWVFFVEERSQEIKNSLGENEHEQMGQGKGKLFKIFGTEWKALSLEQQSKYQLLADKDKLRFSDQQQEQDEKGFYTMADGQLSNEVVPSNAKFLDHVVVPTKPKSNYLFFMMSAQKDIRQQNPDLKLVETSKLIGEQWRNLSDDEKEKFSQIVLKDKLRYEEQVQDLLTKGYFNMQDGSKSSEHQKKIKKKREEKQLSDKESNYFDENLLADDDEKKRKYTKHKKNLSKPGKLSQRQKTNEKPPPAKSSTKKTVEPKPQSAKSVDKKGQKEKPRISRSAVSKVDEMYVPPKQSKSNLKPKQIVKSGQFTRGGKDDNAEIDQKVEQPIKKLGTKSKKLRGENPMEDIYPSPKATPVRSQKMTTNSDRSPKADSEDSIQPKKKRQRIEKKSSVTPPQSGESSAVSKSTKTLRTDKDMSPQNKFAQTPKTKKGKNHQK